MGTAWLQSVVDPASNCSVYIAQITCVKLISTLTRRERASSLSAVDAAAARNAFRAHINLEYKLIEVTELLADQAMLLAETHGLRGYDAVQLVAALQVNASYRVAGLRPITLLSADAELNSAAKAKKLTVVSPNAYP